MLSYWQRLMILAHLECSHTSGGVVTLSFSLWEKKNDSIAFVGYWIIPRVVLEASQIETDLAVSNNRFAFCSLRILPFIGAVNR